MKRKSFVLFLLLFPFLSMAQQQRDMSLSEALKTAIERNLNIQLQRINLESAAISVEKTRAAYEPVVINNTGVSSVERESSSGIEGGTGFVISNENLNFDTTFRKAEDFGLTWSVSFDNSRADSNSSFAFGESYGSVITFGFEQQLLRGFSRDLIIPRYDQYVAEGNLEISEYDLQVQIIDIIQLTENAYWDLVYTIEQLKVTKQGLQLAQQLYDQNKVKIEVGTLAPIELVNTEAEIAAKENEIVTAENNIRAAEDRLKRVLNLPAEQWARLIVPSDSLYTPEIETDLDHDYQIALENRIELRKNHRQVENSKLEYRLRKNELKPELKIRGRYWATGSSNPEVNLDEFNRPIRDADGNIVLLSPSSYGDAFEEAYGFDIPSWSVDLDFTWTPFNKAAKLGLAQARANIRSGELNTELTQITIREELRNAIRELESSLKTIRANEKTLKYRQENVKAELQKFQNGLSTNYRVSQVQNELSEAESQLIQSRVRYIKAAAAYHKAMGRLPEKRNLSM